MRISTGLVFALLVVRSLAPPPAAFAQLASTGIDHFAIGLDPWPGADRALDMVQKRFPKSVPRANLNSHSKAAEIKSVMLKDPNGINVQLGSVKYQL
jgi:hypothetical protein